MESTAWFSNYLAPLAMDGKRAASLGTDAASARTRAFADITNAEVLNRQPGLDKGAKASIGLQPSASASLQPAHQHLQQHQQRGSSLSQQAFTDPSLIDGRQHSTGSATGSDKAAHTWVDVDRQNLEDPQACAPYAMVIFQHLREAEKIRRANPQYLEQVQNDMNSKMRAILVDWLVEVAEEYKLCADTLYLTINYIDRFLSRFVVARSQLQLVGVACMWVAAKYEEIYPPNVQDFCYITDGTYTREQMVKMEEVVLKKLSYELAAPTAKTFLRRLLQVCNPDELLHFTSNYLTELSLLDHVMMQFLPSQIAAAAVYLANTMLHRPAWDGTLQHYADYTPPEFMDAVRALAVLHQAVSSNPQLGAIKQKYAHPRFQSVARQELSASLLQRLGL